MDAVLTLGNKICNALNGAVGGGEMWYNPFSTRTLQRGSGYAYSSNLEQKENFEQVTARNLNLPSKTLFCMEV